MTRPSTAARLQSLADRGTAAASEPSEPYCLDCDERGREVLLVRILCGYRCPKCKVVRVDVVGGEGGISARWVQP